MFINLPLILKRLFKDLTWDKKTKEKVIYLTFDDGPNPEITPKVLKILDAYNSKATFFCVGENVLNFPETYNLVIGDGHGVGNHSYNHISGWKTSNIEYFSNIEKARKLIDSKLFRPPYGRITPSQIKYLKKKYSIIMWSVLTYDFDKKVTKEQCLKNSIINTKPGSVVVFHDSFKSANNMLFALPFFLKHFIEDGYKFEVLK